MDRFCWTLNGQRTIEANWYESEQSKTKCANNNFHLHLAVLKLQALVYDILPSTTAVFSYAIGPRKLSANEQFFCWCSNSRKFVTNNSDYIRRLFYVAMSLTPAQIKPQSFESRRNSSSSFLLGVDASHVYVRAWALDSFHSLISTQTLRRALTASVDSCAEIKSASSVA